MVEMKSVYQWGMVVTVVALLVGCTNDKEQGKPKTPSPVAAAKMPGDMTYQDVLQKGEVVNTLAMTGDGQQIWVGTHNGLYSSAGDGLWALFTPSLEQEDVAGWFVDPEHPDQIYVAGVNGVKRTTDGGKSWTEAGAGLPDLPNIHSFTGIREGNSIRLFAFVTGEGIYQSTNGGEQWKLWLPLDQEVYAMDYHPAEKRLYVATQYGLLYHQNETWETENIPGVEQIYSLAVDRRDGTIAIATEQGILQKTDGEWRPLGAKAPEILTEIAPGAGDTKWVGIGESAYVYALHDDDRWVKWD
jgi:ligand-binding sensor domain-containing protein